MPAARPADAYIGDISRTEGEAKAFFETMRDFMVALPGGDTEGSLTLSSDAVTPSKAFNVIDTESAASTDNFSGIVNTNLIEGSLIAVRAANSGRVITVKHNSGAGNKIFTMDAADVVLNQVDGVMFLHRRGSDWYEVARGLGKSKLGGDAIKTIESIQPDANNNLDLATAGAITITVDLVNHRITIGETHSSLTNNPHSVTATQVGKDTAQWNGLQIQGKTVNVTGRADGTALVFDAATDQYKHSAPPGGGPVVWVLYNPRANTILKQSGGITVTSSGQQVNWATTFPDTNYRVDIATELTDYGSGTGAPKAVVTQVVAQTTQFITCAYMGFRLDDVSYARPYSVTPTKVHILVFN